MKRVSAIILRALLLLSLLLSLCGGCAPAMMAPSPVPLTSSEQREIGVGMMQGYKFTPVSEATRRGEDSDEYLNTIPEGNVLHRNTHIWYRTFQNLEGEEPTETGFLGQFGAYSHLSLGGYWRTSMVKSEHAQLDLQVEGGLLWLGVGLPLGFEVVENLWLTAMPTFRASGYSLAHFPVGIAYELPWGFRVDLSGGIHTYVNPTLHSLDPMTYGALSISYRY